MKDWKTFIGWREKTKSGYMLAGAGVVLLVLCAVFLPGRMLWWQQSKEFMQVHEVPAEYYSADQSALARDASAKLTTEERLQLISGVRASETVKASSEEMELSAAQAAVLAREQCGASSRDIQENYKNWYSYKASPYKSVDTVFHTYTAYYWLICFTRYDGKNTIIILMLEDGTIFKQEGEWK